jgi:preprotein translocase subunit SecD
MTDELTELHEHAEDARERPDLAPITVTMAVLAVLVATVSLLGHRTHTEEIILQNKVTDQWAYYQAKNIRRHNDEMFVDLAAVFASKDADAVAKLVEKYRAEADRYKEEQAELDKQAREMENETEVARRKADRFDLGEVFLEIALVITSIALLSGRRIFWHLGLLMAAGGMLVAASAWMVHL